MNGKKKTTPTFLSKNGYFESESQAATNAQLSNFPCKTSL